jgi:hypothetical protein
VVSESLTASEALSAKGATHPRVSLVDMNDAIVAENYLNVGEACRAMGQPTPIGLDLMTLCFLTMKNGFVVVGKSAPASPENFDEEKGKTFAREDAIRQLWPLMGFSLRDRLANATEPKPQSIRVPPALQSEVTDHQLLGLPYELAAAIRRDARAVGNVPMTGRLDRLRVAIDA